MKENRARDAKAYFTKSEDADTQKEKSRTTQRYFEVFVHNFTVCIFILEFEGLPSLCLLPVCLLSARLICLSSICPPSIQHAYLLSRDAPFYPVCPSSIQYARLLSSMPPSIPPLTTAHHSNSTPFYLPAFYLPAFYPSSICPYTIRPSSIRLFSIYPPFYLPVFYMPAS